MTRFNWEFTDYRDARIYEERLWFAAIFMQALYYGGGPHYKYRNHLENQTELLKQFQGLEHFSYYHDMPRKSKSIVHGVKEPK